MHEKKRPSLHYLLTKIFMVLAVVIPLVSLGMTLINYRNNVQVKLDGFRQMLQTLDATYLYKLVHENERQLEVLGNSLDKELLASGGSAITSSWRAAHRIKMDEHFLYFYHLGSGRLESYPQWVPPLGFEPEQRPWFGLLEDEGKQQGWVGPYTQYGTDRRVLTLVRRIDAPDGHPIGLLMADLPLDGVQQSLERALGSQVGSLYLTDTRRNRMIAAVHPEWLQNLTGQEIDCEETLSWLYHGVALTHRLPYVDWELGIYLPPHLFRQVLIEVLALVLLPALLLLLVVGLRLRSLLRIFKMEIGLVQERLCSLGERRGEHAHRENWFVSKSLGTLEQLEISYQEHKRALRIDALTGIFNRRAFDEDRFKLAKRNEPFTMVLIDVDHFKQINDSFGHQFGDMVLRRIGDALERKLGFPHVYRIGGDEFAALLLSGRQQIEEQLAKLQQEIQAQRWREGECRVSLSMGVAMNGLGDSQQFERADEALYRSKAAGRDCWHFAE